jgi:hypothetical protein
MQYTTDKQWIGGTKAQTIATDAKDASPISAVAFAINETQYVSTLNLRMSKIAMLSQGVPLVLHRSKQYGQAAVTIQRHRHLGVWTTQQPQSQGFRLADCRTPGKLKLYEPKVRHILTSYVSKACWKGNFYGDSDYTKFPTASGLNNTDPFDGQVGMVSCKRTLYRPELH